MTELILSAALRGTFVLGAAWLATWLLRRASADVRHKIWLASLVGLVLLLIPMPLPESMTIYVDATLDSGAMAAKAADSVAVLPVIWAIGCLLFLLRAVLGVSSLARVTREARPAGEFLLSDQVSSPLTWGALRPVILLPAYTETWSREKRAVVLRHERAHIERRDWLSQFFAQLVAAVFWFHPLAWLASMRLQQEAEHATDDLVLASGMESCDYAAQLLEVARYLGRGVPSSAVAVTMVRNSALTERISAILDSARVRARAGRALRAVIMVGCVCSVLLLGACASHVYRIGSGITAPVPLTKSEAEYSEQARRAKYQGTVSVSLIVNKQGKPEDVRVVKSLGMGLDEKAVESLRKWTFKPGTKDGKPVAVRATIEVNFRLL